jgi:cytochrome c5
MSDSHDQNASHEAHEGPIKTPKQLMATIAASFLVPIFGIVLLVNYVVMGDKPAAGTRALGAEAVAARIAPVARVEVKDASDIAAMKTGEQVYQAVCTACHAAGVAGAPKTGDAAAWAPRIKTGYESLLTSVLKGKGAMGAQGGGDYSDYEVARAVVYLTNQAGAKFAEPPSPVASAAVSAAAPAAAPTAPTAPAEAASMPASAAK